MSEDAIKEKIEIYQAAFKNLYEQAIQDLEKLRPQAQAAVSESDLEEVKNRVRQHMFGFRLDKDGNEVYE
jgi:collagenase-like PrtC family protease